MIIEFSFEEAMLSEKGDFMFPIIISTILLDDVISVVIILGEIKVCNSVVVCMQAVSPNTGAQIPAGAEMSATLVAAL